MIYKSKQKYMTWLVFIINRKLKRARVQHIFNQIKIIFGSGLQFVAYHTFTSMQLAENCVFARVSLDYEASQRLDLKSKCPSGVTHIYQISSKVKSEIQLIFHLVITINVRE